MVALVGLGTGLSHIPSDANAQLRGITRRRGFKRPTEGIDTRVKIKGFLDRQPGGMRQSLHGRPSFKRRDTDVRHLLPHRPTRAVSR